MEKITAQTGPLAFIGGGAMTEAIIKGILGAGLADPGEIFVGEPSAARCEYLQKTYGIKASGDNKAVVKDAGLITGNRHGQEVHYHIASTTQAALLHHFVDSYLHTSCPGEFDSQGISHSQTEHFQHESCSCGCSHSDNK